MLETSFRIHRTNWPERWLVVYL